MYRPTGGAGLSSLITCITAGMTNPAWPPTHCFGHVYISWSSPQRVRHTHHRHASLCPRFNIYTEHSIVSLPHGALTHLQMSFRFFYMHDSQSCHHIQAWAQGRSLGWRFAELVQGIAFNSVAMPCAACAVTMHIHTLRSIKS